MDENIETFKLCILAAGRGTRNTSIVGLHKALLPLENRPVISHILDKFPENIEVIIPVGYRSDQIKSYLNYVYSKKNIKFIDIDNFDGMGSGPGYSLLQCKDHLQCPFVFTSADTVLGDDDFIDSVIENWVGVSKIDRDLSSSYCLTKGSGTLDDFYYGKGDTAFIGIAGVKDYQNFWNSLENNVIIKNEKQVIHGFDNLENIKLKLLGWYDTGNNESYELARKKFKNEVVANKSSEAIFIDNECVVKYFDDENKSSLRLERSKFIKDTCPEITKLNSNMFGYSFIKGEMLSNLRSERYFYSFLDFFNENFLSKRFKKDDLFLKDCASMYQDKTRERMKYFSGTSLDNIRNINGVCVDTIENIFSKIDWDLIYKKSIPSYFHGDLQPENIIYDISNERFLTIDWRESFGKSISIGDAYYDLGKLYHGLVINGQTILKGNYFISESGDTASIEFPIRSNLFSQLVVLREFCENNNICWLNVRLAGVLNFINISPLYQNFDGGKYGRFLFLLGKLLLTRIIKNKPGELI